MSEVSHILLIEDEPALRYTLEAILNFGAFSSDGAATALEALEKLRSRDYAAILMDLGLPDVDGATLIQSIRAHSDIPILVVSGREQDKVLALDLGADDFVTKPFLPDELLARIRAVLRRHRSHTTPFLLTETHGPSGGRPGRDDDAEPHLRMGTLEAKLFDYLQRHADQTVPTEDLTETLWGENSDEANNHLRVLIAKLRSKLSAQGSQISILNEWGRGYRLSRTNSAPQQ